MAMLAALTATSAAAGSCGRGERRACKDIQPLTLDLNLSPDVAQKLIADDPLLKAAKKPGAVLPDPTPYTGPSLGVPPNGRGATVGYRWSTD